MFDDIEDIVVKHETKETKTTKSLEITMATANVLTLGEGGEEQGMSERAEALMSQFNLEGVDVVGIQEARTSAGSRQSELYLGVFIRM